MTTQPKQNAIVSQRDREVLEAIDDALGFLMDDEHAILLDALATYRAEIEAATIERCAGVMVPPVGPALLDRAETAWQRFFYPANDCFDKSPAGNKLPFVDLEVADCLRLLLSAVGHEVRPPAGGEVSIIAPADPTVACLKLDVAAQECLQDSAYKAGLAAGWNFAHSDDEAGFQRARSSTEHVAELRRIRAERTAIRNLKGQPS